GAVDQPRAVGRPPAVEDGASLAEHLLRRAAPVGPLAPQLLDAAAVGYPQDLAAVGGPGGPDVLRPLDREPGHRPVRERLDEDVGAAGGRVLLVEGQGTAVGRELEPAVPDGPHRVT